MRKNFFVVIGAMLILSLQSNADSIGNCPVLAGSYKCKYTDNSEAILNISERLLNSGHKEYVMANSEDNRKFTFVTDGRFQDKFRYKSSFLKAYCFQGSVYLINHRRDGGDSEDYFSTITPTPSENSIKVHSYTRLFNVLSPNVDDVPPRADSHSCYRI